MSLSFFFFRRQWILATTTTNATTNDTTATIDKQQILFHLFFFFGSFYSFFINKKIEPEIKIQINDERFFSRIPWIFTWISFNLIWIETSWWWWYIGFKMKKNFTAVKKNCFSHSMTFEKQKTESQNIKWFTIVEIIGGEWRGGRVVYINQSIKKRKNEINRFHLQKARKKNFLVPFFLSGFFLSDSILYDTLPRKYNNNNNKKRPLNDNDG